MDKIVRFEDLRVWQKSHQLTLDVYKVTKNFPQDERYGIISQMRRAAVSVPANISEGFRKKTTKDKLNFYNIAHGSLDELKYYVILSKDLNYIEQSDSLRVAIEDISKMLYGLSKSMTKE